MGEQQSQDCRGELIPKQLQYVAMHFTSQQQQACQVPHVQPAYPCLARSSLCCSTHTKGEAGQLVSGPLGCTCGHEKPPSEHGEIDRGMLRPQPWCPPPAAYLVQHILAIWARTKHREEGQLHLGHAEHSLFTIEAPACASCEATVRQARRVGWQRAGPASTSRAAPAAAVSPGGRGPR